MKNYHSIQKVSQHFYKKNDVLVVFGELFKRGYVNGLIEEAEKAGMKIITATVGRREKDGSLRPLNDSECSEKPYPVINIPLEAGFDLEVPEINGSQDKRNPAQQLQAYKLSQWKDVKLDWASIEQSRKQGRDRFKKSTNQFLSELKKEIPKGANVLFAHTMAGGFPRARIVMPVANKIFKGSGDRYGSSKELWDSEIGQLLKMSFNEVTAQTFENLIIESSNLRSQIENDGGSVQYLAYSYHGTEILINNKYQWQSYSPYLQGWAKMDLENIAKKYFSQGVRSYVFNVPEILTASSGIFRGVEVPLYKLVYAFLKEQPDSSLSQKLVNHCKNLLKESVNLDQIEKRLDNYFTSDLIKNHFTDYENWPQHNSKEQMSLLLSCSKEIIQMHKNSNELMTPYLSEIIFQSCGKAMLAEVCVSEKPVSWIGHDLIAKIS